MIRPSMHSRGTPGSGVPTATPDTGAARVTADARASLAVARALGQLVERLMALGAEKRDSATGADSDLAYAARLSEVRDALRQLAARTREGAMLCRVVGGRLILEGVPIDRGTADSNPHLGVLLPRLVALNVGSLSIREGAAPGELLTLGRMLADSQPHPTAAPNSAAPNSASPVSADTPTTLQAVTFADQTQHELLRTWSVLMTPTIEPSAADDASAAAGSVLSRVAAARNDAAAMTAVDGLIEFLDDLQLRGDSMALEGVVHVVMTQMRQVGENGGRLALERALRHLASAPLLALLAKRLPESRDRTTLLKLFSRAGDAGVATLVEQLMSTDDSLARRAYFDSIVAMDVGSSHLFAALADSRWYVVRNAAALLGEMGVAYADDALIALLGHNDERIRVSIARALMRLKTTKSLQALQAAIDDTNSEVRRLSAAAFGISGTGSGSIRPPAARLSAALDRETDEDATLEMLAALGKLGSADAVQRLLRIALPATADITGTIPGERCPSWLRIAALEALVRARGNHVQPVLDALVSDDDLDVAQAALDLRAQR